MNRSTILVTASLTIGIILMLFFQKKYKNESTEPVNRISSKDKTENSLSPARDKPFLRPYLRQTNITTIHESTQPTQLQIVEEVGRQFPLYVEIKRILTGYEVCRTNPELAHRLTYETYADLGNAHTATADAFSDILWAEQTAQNRQFGSGSEMANPTNNPSILRAVERIAEARRHRAMAIERLERFGVALSGADRLSLLTTEPKESIWIMKDLVPKVGGLGD